MNRTGRWRSALLINRTWSRRIVSELLWRRRRVLDDVLLVMLFVLIVLSMIDALVVAEAVQTGVNSFADTTDRFLAGPRVHVLYVPSEPRKRSEVFVARLAPKLIARAAAGQQTWRQNQTQGYFWVLAHFWFFVFWFFFGLVYLFLFKTIWSVATDKRQQILHIRVYPKTPCAF